MTQERLIELLERVDYYGHLTAFDARELLYEIERLRAALENVADLDHDGKADALVFHDTALALTRAALWEKP